MSEVEELSDDKLLQKLTDFLKNEKYMQQIHVLGMFGPIKLDFVDLISYDINIARMLTEKPRRVLKIIRKAIKNIFGIVKPTEAPMIDEDDIFVEIIGDIVGHQIELRKISSDYIGKLVSIRGILIRVSQIYAVPKKICFECDGEETYVTRESPFDEIPKTIDLGGRRIPTSSCKMNLENSKFIDIQYARIQERPDELPPGEIPCFIDVVLEGPLIGRVTPGDTVVVYGYIDIVRTTDRRDRRYEFRLIALGIKNERRTEVNIDLSPKDIEEIRSEASKEGFYKKVLRSIAPSVFGYEAIKEAILLSIIGGVDMVLPDGTRRRGKIHLLLVGDPGVAKSVLLKYVAQIAPKGIYVTGRGTTAAGLTAAVVKEQGGGMSLEAGAVALADMGVCAIDEIDKMRNEDRVALHEAMEQMTISISKGGITATLNARTTIIAASNPVDGIYNIYKPLTKNIKLPITLISRFDIIHLIRDIPGEKDDQLVDHIISSSDPSSNIYSDIYDTEFLKKYIAYAKSITPRMTEEAANLIKETYLTLRAKIKVEDESGEIENIPITPRQLEAMKRLAEASARAHLRDEVTEEDARIAINQMLLSMNTAAIDPLTGEPDAALLATGVPSRRASLKNIIMDVIKELTEEGEEGCAKLSDIVRLVKERIKVDQGKILNTIEALHKEGLIYQKRTDCYQLVRADLL